MEFKELNGKTSTSITNDNNLINKAREKLTPDQIYGRNDSTILNKRSFAHTFRFERIGKGNSSTEIQGIHSVIGILNLFKKGTITELSIPSTGTTITSLNDARNFFKNQKANELIELPQFSIKLADGTNLTKTSGSTLFPKNISTIDIANKIKSIGDTAAVGACTDKDGNFNGQSLHLGEIEINGKKIKIAVYKAAAGDVVSAHPIKDGVWPKNVVDIETGNTHKRRK